MYPIIHLAGLDLPAFILKLSAQIQHQCRVMQCDISHLTANAVENLDIMRKLFSLYLSELTPEPRLNLSITLHLR